MISRSDCEPLPKPTPSPCTRVPFSVSVRVFHSAAVWCQVCACSGRVPLEFILKYKPLSPKRVCTVHTSLDRPYLTPLHPHPVCDSKENLLIHTKIKPYTALVRHLKHTVPQSPQSSGARSHHHADLNSGSRTWTSSEAAARPGAVAVTVALPACSHER